MSEPSISSEFRVLDRGDFFMLGNMAGAVNPVAILDDTILDKLVVLSRNALVEAAANPPEASTAAVTALCVALSSFLERYAAVRNKYYDGESNERMYAAALRELADALDQMKKLYPGR